MHDFCGLSKRDEFLKNLRPDIKISYNSTERFLEIISELAGLVSLYLIGKNYGGLPETIPTHFSFDGKVDGDGPKSMLYVLIGVEILIYTLITLLSRFPRWFNYPKEITVENAPRQYQLARILFNVLKAETLWFLTLLTCYVIGIAKGELTAANLGVFALIFVFVTFVTSLAFIIRLMKV